MTTKTQSRKRKTNSTQDRNEQARRSSAEATAAANSPFSEFIPNPLRQRDLQIKKAAYYIAERRGFAPGHEIEDWLEAEAEVNRASRPLVSE